MNMESYIPAERYQSLRKRVGSQQRVADLVGVDIRTIQRREVGRIPVTQEAARALYSLVARNMAERLVKTLPELQGLIGVLNK
jgi:hypothetical protein